MTISLRYIVSALGFSLLLLRGITAWALVPSPSPEGGPAVHLTRTQAGVFQDALKALTLQSRSAFVVEGEPLKAALPDVKLADLSGEAAPLSVVVEKLAAAYDYDAERRGNLFLLRKRYTDPNDLPGVTLEESALAVRDVLTILSRHNPRVPEKALGKPTPLLKVFMASLTPEQLRLMNESQGGLPVASLSPRLQAEVRRFALHFYVQNPVEDIERALARLNKAANNRPLFYWSDTFGPPVFGFELLPRSPRGAHFLPLSNPAEVWINGGTIIRRKPRHGAGWQLPDPTVPTPDDLKSAQAPPSAATLAEIIAHLNLRAEGRLVLAVDAALAPKPITIMGGEAAAPVALFQAMADVYGLRVRTEKDGALTLTRRLYRPANNVTALRETVRHVFPEPFLRALKGEAADAWEDKRRALVEGKAGKPVTREQSETRRKQWEAYSKQLRGTETSPGGLRVAAARRLRAFIELRKTTPDERIALSETDPRERMAFANVLMADCLGAVGKVASRRPPGYITQFDQLYLTGGLAGVSDGKQRFGLLLSLLSPDGKNLVSWVGMYTDYRR